MAPTGAILGVGVDGGRAWLPTLPATVVKDGYATVANVARNYDISPDGQRFLMLSRAGEPETPAQLVVVQHFAEELNRLVPVR